MHGFEAQNMWIRLKDVSKDVMNEWLHINWNGLAERMVEWRCKNRNNLKQVVLG